MISHYTNEELQEALEVVCSTIEKCEKMQPKFAVGTSQHTLLKNRIKAMHISKSLMLKKSENDEYTKEELKATLAPVSSIISKCEKGQLKFEVGTPFYNRFKKIIDAMYVAKFLIKEEMNKK